MSDWTLSKIDTYNECVRSDWFSKILNDLTQIFPFPVSIKNGDRTIFSKGTIQGKIEKKIVFDDNFTLTCEFPTNNESLGQNISDDFCSLVKNILIERFNTEFEINSLSGEILDKYEELNLLFDFSQSLGSHLTLDRIFNIILEKVEIALDVDRASIMLYNEGSKTLEVVDSYGFDKKKLETRQISVEKSVSGYVLKNGQALMVDDLNNLPDEVELKNKKEYNSQSFITVPMIFSPIQVSQNKIGVINVTEKRNKKPFSSGDLKLLNSIASMAAIAIYNNRLLEKVLESERLRRDLEIAETIQLGLLPIDFPKLPDLEIYGRCSSAKNIGGDYFDFFLDKNHRLDMLIADVSGHNVSAALMMANTRSVLKSLMQESIPVNEILARANNLLFADMNRAGFFISVFLIRFDRLNRKVNYANGGHHPVFKHQKKTKSFEKLDADGLLLGVLPEVQFEEKTLILEPGDSLVMYTDGLIETSNAKGELYGYQNLKRMISQTAKKNAHDMVDEIFLNLESFSNSASQNDDITLQIMKLKD